MTPPLRLSLLCPQNCSGYCNSVVDPLKQTVTYSCNNVTSSASTAVFNWRVYVWGIPTDNSDTVDILVDNAAVLSSVTCSTQ